MPKVAFFTGFKGFASDVFVVQKPPEYEVTVYDSGMSDDQKVEKVRDADFILSLGGPLTSRVMQAAGNVKLIQLASAGFDSVDVQAAKRQGIPVCNMGMPIAPAVAEHAVLLMLGVMRRVVQVDGLMRTGAWRNDETACMDVPELAGSTVGIVGLGNIGRTVAHYIRGFEPTTLYADVVRYPGIEREMGVRQVPLDELLKSSDIVTVHVPLNDRTRGLIGERQLGLMKPTAILVNASRGPVVDEKALVEALQAGGIAGAGLDVFEQEPLQEDSPLRGMKNVLLSPHIAGNSAPTWGRRARFAFENFRRVLEGKPPLSQVNA
jgi:phosphoglycerate dehydrogenase-like enzyme